MPRESVHRLAAIVEGSDDAIIETDLSGRIRHANPAVRMLFGYEPEELIGLDARVLVPADRVEELASAAAQLVADRPVDVLTTTRVRKDGELFDASLRLSAVRDESGSIVGLSAITRDITAQARTHARLQESEERFRSRFDRSPMPQAIIDLDGCFSAVNDALCQLLARDRHVLEGMHLAQFTHPSDGGAAAGQLADVLTGVRESDSWERIVALPDGSALPVLAHAALLRDARGVAYGVATFVQDLTALRHTERALSRRESLFEALTHQASDWALVLDASGRLLMVTGPFATILGHHPQSLIGRDALQFVHPDDQHRVRDALSAVIAAEGSGDPLLCRVVDSEGGWRWVEQTLTNRLGDPHVDGIVSNGRDVTGRIESEQALRASEARYRAIADTAQEGIWACDHAGRTLYANHKVAGILGVALEAVYDRTAPQLLDPDGISLLAHRIRDRQERGAEEYDVSYVHPDGATRTLRLSVCALRDDAKPIGSLAMISDTTEAERTAAELRHRALYDELTGLANRTLLLDRLTQAVARSRLPGHRGVAVLFADLDQFKLVNDSLGHATGDRLLVHVASCLTRTAGPGDTVARFGGDGFVIVSEGTDDVQAAALANAVQSALAGPFELDDQRLHATVSIGIATSRSDSGEHTAGELLRFADTAMYDAKARGRGHVHFFDIAFAQHAARQLALSNDLREALDQDQLALHYQPIVELASGRVIAVEALARWRHPLHGPILPDQFVSLAESTGLAVELDRWALRRACHDLAELHDGSDASFPVSVNISARHLIDSDLEATVLAALRDSGLPGSSLVLEITESTAVDDPGHARDLLDRLRQHGVRVAIDNIGTGYSSLGYLNRLPAATLKIDRSLVVDVTENPDSFAVAAAIIDLARAIRLTTMAEGIETREQLGLLRRLGCAAGQGLLWSAALPPAQLLVQLAALRGGHFDVSVPDSLTPAPRRPKAREVVTVEHGVHRMLRLHDDGASLNTIAAALNAEGFRTPAGQRWHRVTVARAITDVAYPHLDEAPR